MKKDRIVIIDDMVEILEIMEKMLEDYSVSTFTNINSAMKYIKHDNTDLIITDLSIQKKDDGFKILNFVSENKINIPVIIMTGSVDIEEYYKKYGSLSFLGKPFNSEMLLEKIKKFI